MGAVIGASGVDFNYASPAVPLTNLNVTGVYDVIPPSTTLNFGTLTIGAVNANVTPTFVLGVTPTINSAPESELFFKGTIGATTISMLTCGTDATCAHPANTSTFGIANYPTAPPGNDTFVFQNLGGYSFGIEESVAINTSGSKITTLFGFIAPSTATAPEPVPAATTGLAVAGLLALALRRKLQIARS